jgi:methionyl-tRNA synthetase
MNAVLGTLVRAIRDLAIAIEPVVPASAATLLSQLGQSGRGHDALGDHGWYAEQRAAGFRIAPPTPIFPRLTITEVEPA